MGFTFKLDTKKLESVIRNTTKLDGTQIDVGFFEEDKYGPENDNLQVAQVAYFNERGTLTNPRRPFMATTFGDRETQDALGKIMSKTFQSSLIDGRQVQRLLKELGSEASDRIRKRILTWPGSNSRATIERKGKNTPLRDTDIMLESVKFKLR